MGSCKCCGLETGGDTCSMCYGEAGHGGDRYYEEEMRREEERLLEEKLREEDIESLIEIANKVYEEDSL